MSPSSLLFNDQTNVARANVEPLSNHVLSNTRRDQRADFQNVRSGQFSVALFLASAGSALKKHVAQIISLRSLEKMIGIATQRPVASMTDRERRPIARHKKEGEAVRVIVPLNAARKRPEIPVMPNGSFSPLPTCSLRAVAGSFINVAPKPFGLLFGQNGRVSINSSHDLNLLRRLGLWLGSFAVQPAFGPFAFYHAEVLGD